MDLRCFYFVDCFLKKLQEKYEVIDEGIEVFCVLFKEKLEEYTKQVFDGEDIQEISKITEEYAEIGVENFYTNLEGMCFDEIVFRARYEQEFKENVEKILDLKNWMEKFEWISKKKGEKNKPWLSAEERQGLFFFIKSHKQIK